VEWTTAVLHFHAGARHPALPLFLVQPSCPQFSLQLLEAFFLQPLVVQGLRPEQLSAGTSTHV
jgi:hypothetical protein